MQFHKDDMEGSHYNWSHGDEQVFSGQPSRRNFDRFNGVQVLFLINYYGRLSEDFTVEKGKKIEQKILRDLPLEAKSEISVFKWVENTLSTSD